MQPATTPYRPVPEDKVDRAERTGRWATIGSTPLLAVMAFTVFAPTMRECGRVVVPAERMAREPISALTMGWVYLYAAGLLIATLAAIVRRSPPRDATHRVALTLMGLYGAGGLASVGFLVFGSNSGIVAGVMAAMGGFALWAGWSLWLAANRRPSGYARWTLLLAAYAVFTGAAPTTLLQAGESFAGNGLWGAHAHLAAWMALLILTLSASFQLRRLSRAEAAREIRE